MIPRRFKVLLDDMVDDWEDEDKGNAPVFAECEEPTMAELTVKGVPEAEWPYYLGYMKRMLALYRAYTGETLLLEKTNLIEEYVLRGKNRDVLEQVQEVAAECAGIPPPVVVKKYCYVGSTNTWSESQVEKINLDTYSLEDAVDIPASPGVYLCAMVIDVAEEYLYVAEAVPTTTTISKVRLSDFTVVATLDLDGGDDYVYGLVIEGNYLYACTSTSPARVVKINLSTFTRDDVLALNSGENYAAHILSDGTYLYVILSLAPCRVVRVVISTFTRDSCISLIANREEYGGRSIIHEGKLYVPTSHYVPPNPLHNRLVKIDLASFTREDFVAVTPDNPIIVSPVHDGYVYVGGLYNHPPVLSKVELSSFTEVDTLILIQANGVEYGNPQWGMIINGDFLYLSLDQYSPASIDKVDLTDFTEVGLCQVWDDVWSIASALAV